MSSLLIIKFVLVYPLMAKLWGNGTPKSIKTITALTATFNTACTCFRNSRFCSGLYLTDGLPLHKEGKRDRKSVIGGWRVEGNLLHPFNANVDKHVAFNRLRNEPVQLLNGLNQLAIWFNKESCQFFREKDFYTRPLLVQRTPAQF